MSASYLLPRFTSRSTKVMQSYLVVSSLLSLLFIIINTTIIIINAPLHFPLHKGHAVLFVRIIDNNNNNQLELFLSLLPRFTARSTLSLLFFNFFQKKFEFFFHFSLPAPRYHYYSLHKGHAVLFFIT